MSEKLSAAAAASVRAAMLDPSKLAGARKTKTPLPRVQRLAGGEMAAWCVVTDLQAVLSPLLRHPSAGRALVPSSGRSSPRMS